MSRTYSNSVLDIFCWVQIRRSYMPVHHLDVFCIQKAPCIAQWVVLSCSSAKCLWKAARANGRKNAERKSTAGWSFIGWRLVVISPMHGTLPHEPVDPVATVQDHSIWSKLFANHKVHLELTIVIVKGNLVLIGEHHMTTMIYSPVSVAMYPQ